MDVVAMYPSLIKEPTAEICSNLVVESGIKFTTLDWTEGALYLVLTAPPEDLVDLDPSILPTRKH